VTATVSDSTAGISLEEAELQAQSSDPTGVQRQEEPSSFLQPAAHLIACDGDAAAVGGGGPKLRHVARLVLGWWVGCAARVHAHLRGRRRPPLLFAPVCLCAYVLTCLRTCVLELAYLHTFTLLHFHMLASNSKALQRPAAPPTMANRNLQCSQGCWRPALRACARATSRTPARSTRACRCG